MLLVIGQAYVTACFVLIARLCWVWFGKPSNEGRRNAETDKAPGREPDY